MPYKSIFIIAILLALAIATYIVYQNRASDNLVSMKELKFKTPNVNTSTTFPINTVKSQKIYWSDLTKIFKNNPFISNGFSTQIENFTDIGISFPPKTKINFESNRHKYLLSPNCIMIKIYIYGCKDTR